MAALLELSPLLAFLVAYWIGGIYVATGALMAAMGALLLVDLLLTRRVPKMHALSALLVWALGSATLLLRDVRFIQWKPTVFMWLLSIVFLGSAYIGKQPLAQRLLAQALADQPVPDRAWRQLNGAWVVFYALAGAANILLATYYPAAWAVGHVVGLLVANFAFIVGQALWLGRKTTTT